ncbi:Hypothetical_protein [Hexamita inflata]|uniref:Hypothetical_protein n=1 Tax=Hexamita inflata TaxID=28002 RepID=A0ABP1IKK5_9EUKA
MRVRQYIIQLRSYAVEEQQLHTDFQESRHIFDCNFQILNLQIRDRCTLLRILKNLNCEEPNTFKICRFTNTLKVQSTNFQSTYNYSTTILMLSFLFMLTCTTNSSICEDPTYVETSSKQYHSIMYCDQQLITMYKFNVQRIKVSMCPYYALQL